MRQLTGPLQLDATTCNRTGRIYIDSNKSNPTPKDRQHFPKDVILMTCFCGFSTHLNLQFVGHKYLRLWFVEVRRAHTPTLRHTPPYHRTPPHPSHPNSPHDGQDCLGHDFLMPFFVCGFQLEWTFVNESVVCSLLTDCK